MTRVGKGLGLLAMVLISLSMLARAGAQSLPGTETLLGRHTGPSSATPSVSAGAALFRRGCAACHSTERGQADNLRGVFNAGAGQRPGMQFTDSLKYSGKIWNAAQLDSFLADPPRAVPGTTMRVKLPNADDRRDVIAYLMTLQ